MRFLLAIRIFFSTLFNGAVAKHVKRIVSAPALPGEGAEQRASPPQLARPLTKAPPARSEALTLLAALQREARFVDFVKEPLGDYTDAQIGAAARDVLRDCHGVLDRLFGLVPVVSDAEGASVELPKGFDAGRYRMTGDVSGEPPFRGRLVHHGWEATKCELPTWSGSKAAAGVVAAAEVELR